MNLKELTIRIEVAKINLEDFSKVFTGSIEELFGMELDYSFIKNDILREKLKKHSLRMAFYRLGLGNSVEDSFENYCKYVYHQLEGVANYYFMQKYPTDINPIKYNFIRMNIKNRFLRYQSKDSLPKDIEEIYWSLVAPEKEGEVDEKEGKLASENDREVDEKERGIEKKEREDIFIKHYQELSTGKIDDPFFEKHKKGFEKLKLAYINSDKGKSFFDQVWKIHGTVKEVEKIDFQPKINLILNEMYENFDFLKSPVKQLSDWRNQELMHTSSKEPNIYVKDFKNKKNYMELFEELQKIRDFVEASTNN